MSGSANPGVRVLDAAASSAVCLRGSNTGDVFIDQQRVRRLPVAITAAFAEAGFRTIHVRPSGAQWADIDTAAAAGFELPDHQVPPGEAMFRIVSQLRGDDRPTLVLVLLADLRVPEGGVSHGLPSADQALLIETLADFPTDTSLSSHRLVLIGLHDTIDEAFDTLPGWSSLAIDLPDTAHLMRGVQRIADAATTRQGLGGLASDLTVAQAARAAGGLRLDDLLRRSGSGRDITRQWIQTTKATLLSSGPGGMQVLPPGDGFDRIAGAASIKLFLQRYVAAGELPHMIVLAGPPGTGKSLSAGVIGDVLAAPVARLEGFFDPYLGQTERTLRAMQDALLAVAPAVAYIDEVDGLLGNRDASHGADTGGTTSRIFGQLLSFLGDDAPDLGLVVVAATNRPDLLDNAVLSRATVIPVLHPTASAQSKIVQLELRRRGADLDLDTIAAAVITGDERLRSGRSMARLAERAVLEAKGAGRSVSARDLHVAMDDLVEDVGGPVEELMALLAIQATTWESTLPWRAAQALGEDVELLPYVRPILRDGRLDRTALENRIMELRLQAEGIG